MTNFEKWKEKIMPEMVVSEMDCRDCPAQDYCRRHPENYCMSNFCEWAESSQDFNPRNDKLFLLSEEEYNSVKESIEKYCAFQSNCWWWLRSPGYSNNDFVRLVYCDGYVGSDYIKNANDGVAPAFIEKTDAKVGTIQIKYKFPFIYVGNNIWISENFIFWDRFDEESNNYETSEIRQKILKWAEERSN